MKKIISFICIALLSCTAWATEPENIVRAYNNPNGGYVLIDADEQIIGFSNEGKLTKDNADGVKALLAANELELVIAENGRPNRAASDDDYSTVYVMSDSVGPLLKDIAYNQGHPYNLWTPAIGNTHTVTGCVATAMAQIMAYWKYPQQCNPEVKVDYYTKTRNFHVQLDYDTVRFNWNNILHNYAKQESNAAQRNEIAKLMFACGAAVQMDYNTSSGTMSQYVPGALVSTFGYKDGIMLENVENISDIMAEIDAGRPMYCSGTSTVPGYDGGHAFVLDGYGWLTPEAKQAAPTNPFIHFNWGWGGYDQQGNTNLWYMMSGRRSLSPYRSFQVIRGIQPPQATDDKQVEINAKNDNKIYDILGREVSETTAGHIYIRNGKKFIAQ